MESNPALPIFEQSCREALERTRGDPSPLAEALHAEARELLGILEQWKKDTPPPEDRADVIKRIMEVFRKALAYSTGAKPEEPAE
jgi:hypothetical protein